MQTNSKLREALNDTVKLLCDTIEHQQEQLKTKVGDAAKSREAVGYILKYADSAACRDHDEHTRHYIDQIRKWAQSALAEPPRQCNIGTAAEQTKRFKDFCERHGECMGEDCTCPIVFTPGICELVWAQLPYEEGGAK